MSLVIWLPLDGDLRNQGVLNPSISATTPSYTVGKIGQCYKGTDLTITTNNNFGKIWSLCFWGYVIGNSITSNWTLIARLNDNKSNLRIEVCPSSYSNGIYCYSTHNNSSNVITNGSIASPSGGYYDKWAHFCLTSDGTTITKYMNGIKIGTSNYTGSGYINGTFFFANNDKIYKNDIRIYDHCLSAAEVHEIAQGLVLHYKLDGGLFGNPNLLARYVVPGQAAPTSTANGGRTTWLGDYKITIPATENADTYFRLFMTEQLISGITYTISCKVSGLLNGSYYRFPLFAQSNTSMGVLIIDHNGLCSLTFTMNWTGTQTAATGANGETVYVNFLDDSARSLISGQGPITLYDFKLEKGDAVTTWCPADNELAIDRTIVSDSSGYGHNGVIVGDVLINSTSPRYQCCSKLNSTDLTNTTTGSAYIQTEFGLTTPETITIAWWANPENGYGGTVNHGAFATSNNSLPTDYYTTAFNHRDAGFDISPNGNTSASGVIRLSMSSYTKNEWHHYAVVYNGQTATLYKDGVSTATAAFPEKKILASFARLFIGLSRAGGAQRKTVGSYSDFRIYVTPLLDKDIKLLYNTSMRVDNSQGIHSFEFDETSTKNQLTKTGILKNNIIEPYITLPDGSYWKLMLFHYVDGGNNLFTSSNATYCDDFGLYSRLRDINNYTYNNSYEFYVIQDGKEFRWTQTSQPTASSITGLTTVSGYNSPVNGLAKPTSLSQTYIGYNAWWGACGCWTSYSTGGKTGIPGFGSHDANGICTTYLVLYTRIEKPKAGLANLTNYANNFIEN